VYYDCIIGGCVILHWIWVHEMNVHIVLSAQCSRSGVSNLYTVDWYQPGITLLTNLQ